ncbi:MAG: hypothetical protein HQK66_13750, partial [Desulfamplus sp.]|nr:hypothetical protein [Desulfamplus sp.]
MGNGGISDVKFTQPSQTDFIQVDLINNAQAMKGPQGMKGTQGMKGPQGFMGKHSVQQG